MTRRITAALALVAAVLLAFAAGPAGAASREAPVKTYTGSYTGSLSYSDVDPAVGDLNGLSSTASLSWTVKVTERYRGDTYVSGTVHQAAQGTSLQTCSGSGCVEPPSGCHVSQKSTTALPGQAQGDSGDVVRPAGIFHRPDSVTGRFVLPPLVASDIQGNAWCTTSTDTAADWWASGVCVSLPQYGGESTIWADGVDGSSITALDGSGARHFDVDQSTSGNCFGATETQTRTLHAEVTIGGGGHETTPTPPRADPQRTREKQAARGDLKTVLHRLPLPCGITSVGATSLLWSATVPGVGQAALIPGTLITTVTGPLCATLLKRAYDDAVIVNDPPRGDIDTIARVPRTPRLAPSASCARDRGGARRFCDAVSSKLAAYVTSVRDATTVDDAIATTIDRQTAALDHHDRSALARQNAAGRRLEARYATALAAQSRAGVALARLISAHHIRGRLTTAQDTVAIAAVTRRLDADRHTTTAALGRLLGADELAHALAPAPVNLLTLLR